MPAEAVPPQEKLFEKALEAFKEICKFNTTIKLNFEKIMEKYIEQSSSNQEILQDEVMYLKSLCRGATKLVSETMNTVSFIINNFTVAPPIDKNIDYKQILYDNNKEKIDVIEEIIHHYRHKSLTKYIGDMIVKCYKKEDPSQQSIWNSDVTRKNYLLRELINTKPEWIPDKKGIKTIEIDIICTRGIIYNGIS